MSDDTLLLDVGLALGVAGVTSLAFGALRQSTVLAWLAAGLVVGPYIPIPIFADPERVEALSEFGVVLVMFGVGLELRLRRLLQVLPATGLVAVIQIGALIWIGVVIGQLLGWSATGALFLGGSLAVSSTMVVSRVFEHVHPEPAVRDQVLGVLVLQDVAAVGIITVFTAVAAGAEVSAAEAARALGRILLLGAALLGGGLLVVPRLVRFAVALKRPDVLVVATTALCFALALAAQRGGASPALGAFVAGVLAAESGRGHELSETVRPLQDVFAAIFFVSVGMTVDPLLVVVHLPAVLGVSAAVIVGQLLSVGVAGVLAGAGLRASLTSGLYLGQIGEFSFVIAGIGAAVAPPELRAIVVGAAVVTTFTTPVLAARSGPLVAWVDDHLPRPLRTLLVVYEGWVAASARRRAEPSPVRTLIVDAALLGLVVTGLLAAARPLAALLDQRGVPVGAPALRAVGAALALPLVAVLVHATRKLARSLVARMLPEGEPRPALAAVVSRAVELAVLLAVGLPLAAALDLLLPVPIGGAALAIGVAISAVAVWRSARTAGGVLRTAADQAARALAEETPPPAPPKIVGLDIAVVDVVEGSAGRTLAELDLRAITGATVVAIHRDAQEHVTLPTGREQLRAGDRLALVGTPAAIGRARELVATGIARVPDGGAPVQ